VAANSPLRRFEVGGVQEKIQKLAVWNPKRLADMTTVQKIKEIEDEMVIFWNYKDLGY
jgi:hypothetical protein